MIGMRRLVAIALGLILVGTACNGLGPNGLDDFVVTWQLRVLNRGVQRTSVTATLANKTVTASMDTDGSVVIRSFQGGGWSIHAVGTTERRAYLEEIFSRLSLTLSHQDPNTTLASDIAKDIETVEMAMVTAEGNVGGGFCNGTMNDESGDDLTIELQQDEQGNWYCLAEHI
jgi:hypothetical protein